MSGVSSLKGEALRPSVNTSGATTPTGHRRMQSATVGYVAPEFAGKIDQKAAGKFHFAPELAPRAS